MFDTDAEIARLVHKLGLYVEFDDTDLAAIRSLPFRFEVVRTNRHLLREGAVVKDYALICAGYACRYKVAYEGRRLIGSVQLPGDGLNFRHRWLARSDDSLVTITDATIGWVSAQALYEVADRHPAIARAMNIDTAIEASIARDTQVNVGVRTATTRIAHLFCELFVRRAAGGVPLLKPFVMPLTQQHIGDATGVTAVHVNRMLRQIANTGALDYRGRTYTVRDWPQLRQLADFNSDYLYQLGHADRVAMKPDFK